MLHLLFNVAVWSVAGAQAPDPLLDLPILDGTRVRNHAEISVAGPDCSQPATDVLGPYASTDVVVLAVPTGPGTWSMQGRPAQAHQGQVVLPDGLSEGTHRVCVQTQQGAAVVDVVVRPAGATQISIHDLRADGSERGRSISVQPIDNATEHLRWQNPDAIFTEVVYDEKGNPLQIDRIRDWTHSIYRNTVTLPEAVAPGDWLVLDQRLLVEPFRITEVATGEYRFAFTHRPRASLPTRYVQAFVLPQDAELLDAEGLRQGEWHGRILLTHDRLITAGGSASTTFRYRLPTEPPATQDPQVVGTSPEDGAVGVDPKLTEIRVTFSHDMRDSTFSFVRSDHDDYPKVTGPPRFVDARTCVLPVKLKKGRTYTLWVNHPKYLSFRGKEGGVAVPYSFSFTTAADTERR